MIYGNFIPANEQEGATKIGDVTKAFYRKISHRKHPTPDRTEPSNLDCVLWNSPCINTTPAYFRDFNSKLEHTYSTHPCEMGLAIVTLHISSQSILWCHFILLLHCTDFLFFFFFFILPEYSFIAGDTFPKQNISIFLLRIRCSRS